jgi:Bacterial PH domain
VRILDVEPVLPGEAAELTPHLSHGEAVDAAFVSATGTLLFTDLRLLLVTREHLLEERVETTSWPYREVRHFAVQEIPDGRASLRIWLGDEPQPLHLRARAGVDLGAVQRLLAARLA